MIQIIAKVTGPDNEYKNIELTINGKYVGDIELQLLDMENAEETEAEWLLKYYESPDRDPLIIKQGHVTK